jgi:hypothetical protein
MTSPLLIPPCSSASWTIVVFNPLCGQWTRALICITIHNSSSTLSDRKRAQLIALPCCRWGLRWPERETEQSSRTRRGAPLGSKRRSSLPCISDCAHRAHLVPASNGEPPLDDHIAKSSSKGAAAFSVRCRGRRLSRKNLRRWPSRAGAAATYERDSWIGNLGFSTQLIQVPPELHNVRVADQILRSSECSAARPPQRGGRAVEDTRKG